MSIVPGDEGIKDFCGYSVDIYISEDLDWDGRQQDEDYTFESYFCGQKADIFKLVEVSDISQHDNQRFK